MYSVHKYRLDHLISLISYDRIYKNSKIFNKGFPFKEVDQVWIFDIFVFD